jgi:hypothetical protein
MIEQIQFAKLFGVARIDSLLQEMLLGGEFQVMHFYRKLSKVCVMNTFTFLYVLKLLSSVLRHYMGLY